tara:strand:+ start:573 stop:722 length:150 start_codon:yes stop_codon:yes gene_type:complete
MKYMVEIYKKITKMGDRYIINIPNETVEYMKKEGLIRDEPIKVKIIFSD